MPGRLFLNRSTDAVAAQFGVPNCPAISPRANIAPGQDILTLTAGGWRMMRWGIIPVGRKNARGRPVMETLINARSETLFDKSAYDGVGRAVIPCDGWYEWTGERRKKTPWAITPKDGSILAFAAICDLWAAPGGQELWQVAAVTCPPNRDLRDIHHRMGVLLHMEDVQTWLTGSQEQAETLLRPYPDDRLAMTKAQGVDWSGA